jgi:hypothetical protein
MFSALQRARFCEVPSKDASVFVDAESLEAVSFDTPLATDKNPSVYCARPIGVHLSLRQRLSFRDWQRPVDVVTLLIKSRVSFYTDSGCDATKYLRMIHGDHYQHLRGLDQLFGQERNSLRAIFRLCRVAEHADLLASCVSMVCLQFYAMCRRRFLVYNPDVFSEKFFEKYPPFLMIIYWGYDFKHLKEFVMKEKTDMVEAACTHTYHDFVKGVLGYLCRATNITNRKFTNKRQKKNDFSDESTLRADDNDASDSSDEVEECKSHSKSITLDDTEEHVKDALAREFDFVGYIRNQLQRNFELFLSSRGFSNMTVPGLVEDYNRAVSDPEAAVSGMRPRDMRVKKHVHRFYPQHILHVMEAWKRTARNSFTCLLPSFYAHVWFSPSHPIFVDTGSNLKSASAASSVFVIAQQVSFVCTAKIRVKLNASLNSYRKDILSDAEIVLPTKPAKRGRGRPQTRAVAQHTPDQISLKTTSNLYFSGQLFDEVRDWLDPIRLRYCYWIGERLYYMPPWHKLFPDDPVDEASETFLTPMRLFHLGSRGKPRELPEDAGVDPSVYRCYFQDGKPLALPTPNGIPLAAWDIAVITEFYSSYPVMCALPVEEKWEKLFVVYRAWAVILQREEDLITTIAAFLSVPPSSARLCTALRENRRVFDARCESQTLGLLAILPQSVSDKLEQAVQKQLNGEIATELANDNSFSVLFPDVESTLLLLQRSNAINHLIEMSTGSKMEVDCFHEEERNDSSEPIDASQDLVARRCADPMWRLSLYVYSAIHNKREKVYTSKQDIADAERFLREIFIPKFRSAIWWPVLYYFRSRCPAPSIFFEGRRAWHDMQTAYQAQHVIAAFCRGMTNLIQKQVTAKGSDFSRAIMDATERERLEDPKLRYAALAIASHLPVSGKHGLVRQKLCEMTKPVEEKASTAEAALRREISVMITLGGMQVNNWVDIVRRATQCHPHFNNEDAIQFVNRLVATETTGDREKTDALRIFARNNNSTLFISKWNVVCKETSVFNHLGVSRL